MVKSDMMACTFRGRLTIQYSLLHSTALIFLSKISDCKNRLLLKNRLFKRYALGIDSALAGEMCSKTKTNFKSHYFAYCRVFSAGLFYAE